MGARARSIAVPERGTVLLEKYEVEGVLGFGGMGVVLSAHHRQLARRVAIKLLTPPHSTRPETRKRFRAEARAVSLLTSEHVCRVLDAGELEDEIKTPFIVMEFLDGNHLGEWLRSQGEGAEQLPSTELAVEIVLQACVGIAEAHSKGIVHRDIKPANLVVMERAPDGAPFLKVIDFGVSKNLALASDDESAAPTRTYAYLGSPLYSSPEQLISARAATPLSDQWSLGVVLYQCLTKSVPFDAPAGGAVWRVAEAIERDAPIPLSVKRPSSCPRIDPDLERAVMRTLEKVPERRFASISEFASALAPYGGARATELLRQIKTYDNKSTHGSVALQSSASEKAAPPPVVEPWTQDVVASVGAGDRRSDDHHASATLAMATLSSSSSSSSSTKASFPARSTSWSRKRQILAFVVGAAAIAGVIVNARWAKAPTVEASSAGSSPSPSPSPMSLPTAATSATSAASATSATSATSAASVTSTAPLGTSSAASPSSVTSVSSAPSASPHAPAASHASRPPPPSVRATSAPRFLKTRSGE